MRLGVTGHQELPSDEAWAWVEETLKQELVRIQDITGVSSLAVGADQLFARCVLENGGNLVAVIPFPDYNKTFKDQSLAEYERLLQLAGQQIVLPFKNSKEESYMIAGITVVDMCDQLFAIWNGLPARGKGGTADVVAYANQIGKPTLHLDPFRREVTKL